MDNPPHHQSTGHPAKQTHRKQLFWQILLPILVAAVAVLAIGMLAILTAGNPNSKNATWAMISTIFMVLPWLLFSLVPLALLFFFIRLLKNARASITPHLATAAGFSRYLQMRTDSITQAAAAPLIRTRATIAGLIHLLRMAFHKDIQ